MKLVVRSLGLTRLTIRIVDGLIDKWCSLLIVNWLISLVGRSIFLVIVVVIILLVTVSIIHLVIISDVATSSIWIVVVTTCTTSCSCSSSLISSSTGSGIEGSIGLIGSRIGSIGGSIGYIGVSVGGCIGTVSVGSIGGCIGERWGGRLTEVHFCLLIWNYWIWSSNPSFK